LDVFEAAAEEEEIPGSLNINGTLVPPSYSLVLNPDNGEADAS
jgi:hypothetical protein